jgi:hypothetical protein
MPYSTRSRTDLKFSQAELNPFNRVVKLSIKKSKTEPIKLIKGNSRSVNNFNLSSCLKNNVSGNTPESIDTMPEETKSI